VIADISNDPTYAEVLYELFGARVIGVQITRYGDGLEVERRAIKNGFIWVYKIGRTNLFDLLHREFDHDNVRILPGPESMRAYEQLMSLDVDVRDSGRIYRCPTGQHDDLGISCAIVGWAARHPHLEYWKRPLQPKQPRKGPEDGWGASVEFCELTRPTYNELANFGRSNAPGRLTDAPRVVDAHTLWPS